MYHVFTYIRTYVYEHMNLTNSLTVIAFLHSWLCCYLTQMNPLIGPKLSMNEIMIMAREWGNEIKDTMDITV